MAGAMRAASGTTEHLKITKTSLEKALKGDRSSKRILADTVETGLRLVVNAKSSSWSYAFRRRGTDRDGRRWPQRTILLGRPENVSVEAARELVRRIKATVAAGGDPVEDAKSRRKREADELRLAELRRVTCKEAVKRYLRSPELQTKSDHHREGERVHLGLALTEMNCSDIPVDKIDRKMIKALAGMHAGKAATQRNRVGAVRRMLAYMVDEDVLEANPATDIKLAKPRARTRKYSAAEIRSLWNAELPPVRRRFLRAMVLMPLRIGEMSEIRVEHVKDGWIELPGHLTKNGDAFSLPIPPGYAPLFEGAAGAKNGDRVFQLARDPAKAFSAHKRYYEAIVRATVVDDFGFHHMRRTFVSVLAEHGIGNADLTDAMLNHRQSETKSGVREHYHQADLKPQMAQVMAAWGRLLEHAVKHGKWPREATGSFAGVVSIS